MPTFQTDSLAITYSESGFGAVTLLLLHGFPFDSRMWNEQASALASDARVVAPDLRGFGQSRSDTAFTIESLADDIHELVLGIEADPVILGGFSMGGYIALAYAHKYPNDLAGLILVDTKAEADTLEVKAGRNKMIELVQSGGSAAVAAQMLPKLLAPGAAERAPAVAKSMQAIMESCPPATIEHALQAMRDRMDYTLTLANIRVPTLILVGEADALTPPAMAEAMHALIPRSRLSVIRGAGHAAPMEQPEQVTGEIRQFLTEQAAPSAVQR